jgi:hypothetical protein
MKLAEDPNLEGLHPPEANTKRRYEAPRLLVETMDVRGTSKSFHSVIDLHPGLGGSSGSGPSIS